MPDSGESLRRERASKDAWFRAHPQSPLPREERAKFAGLRYYDPDPAYKVRARWEPLPAPKPVHVQTSTGETREYVDAGLLRFRIDGNDLALHGYDTGHGLFVPFRDATSGKETYGAGRYLDLPAPRGGEVEIDFNLAYNPYCAYSEDYSCPFPPPDNWLKAPIRAGEKSYHD